MIFIRNRLHFPKLISNWEKTNGHSLVDDAVVGSRLLHVLELLDTVIHDGDAWSDSGHFYSWGYLPFFNKNWKRKNIIEDDKRIKCVKRRISFSIHEKSNRHDSESNWSGNRRAEKTHYCKDSPQTTPLPWRKLPTSISQSSFFFTGVEKKAVSFFLHLKRKTKLVIMYQNVKEEVPW